MGTGSEQSLSEQESEECSIDPGVDGAPDFLVDWFLNDVFAKILVSDDLFVIMCNHAARDILAEINSISIKDGVLKLRDKDQDLGLRALLGSAKGGLSQFTVGDRKSATAVIQIQRVAGRKGSAFGLTLRNQGSLKTSDVSNIRKQFKMTRTEERIIIELSEGRTLKDIGRRNGTSYETVRSHVRNIYRKLGIGSRVELIHAIRHHTGDH